jgi:hypothetical protein
VQGDFDMMPTFFSVMRRFHESFQGFFSTIDFIGSFHAGAAARWTGRGENRMAGRKTKVNCTDIINGGNVTQIDDSFHRATGGPAQSVVR